MQVRVQLKVGRALETSVGAVLGGRYRIQSTLGAGGMAVVYRAEDAILGRTVALKTLHRRYAEMPSFRRRFKQEARAMASLDHENIVKVYDIAHDGEVPFIVAECVAGRDLGTLLAGRRGGSLNEHFMRRVVAQLLRALSYAHERGIIHRDIKPSNILVTAGGTVKVADFGIARILEDDASEAGEPGEIVGSARYMSPEQLKGLDATSRSDVYSVGVLLYHCLTGRAPFSGDVKSLARQHIHTDPTPPRKVNKKITRHAEAVILRAMAKDPEDRYPTAAAMLDDLEADLPPRSTRTSETPKSFSGRGRRSLLLALAASLMILVGAAGLASGLGYLDPVSYRGAVDALGQMKPLEEVEPPAPTEPSDEPAASEERENEAPPGQQVAAREPRELVPVPDVTAYFDYYAEDTLASSGFDVEFVYEYRDGFAPRGVTWGTDPAGGTLAPEGSTVTVYATPEDLAQPEF
ncbi:MAG TPA: protein kinase [Rubrobacteraceae bacterium]|nr:protein kinase [Rubrobacteraceae bacterium]